MKKLIIDITDIALKTGKTKPVIFTLIPSVITAMKEPYPELAEKEKSISGTIKNIEEAYIKVRKERLPQFENDAKKISKEKLIELYKTHGTVRAITESTNLSVYDVNRLIKIYNLKIMPLRKNFLKRKLITEYKEMAKKFNGQNPSTYDLLFIKDGRNLSASAGLQRL